MSTRASSSKSFSSFTTKKFTVANPAFGAREKRFANNTDLKELYNKDPGPGTYGEKARMIESNLAESMAKLKDLKGDKIEMEFISKQKRFIKDADMLDHDPTINVGPGQYSP